MESPGGGEKENVIKDRSNYLPHKLFLRGSWIVMKLQRVHLARLQALWPDLVPNGCQLHSLYRTARSEWSFKNVHDSALYAHFSISIHPWLASNL